MEWIPIVFVTFKLLALATGMFFAIKWHYDQGKKNPNKEKELRAVVRAGGKAAAVFAVVLVGLVLLTFYLIKTFGM